MAAMYRHAVIISAWRGRMEGINHACDAIGAIVVFLADLDFFMQRVAVPRAKSDVKSDVASDG
jgi:hypothetical protein